MPLDGPADRTTRRIICGKRSIAMRNQKSSTRRTLTLSIMAICLCCVMLVGATFAWFTDTATSGVNKIQSGNLDLKVEYNLTGKDAD